jgi:prepilin-type N-terminal cleavage/methylation domain-containing protein
MLAKLRTMKQDEGFTLVELLVVIAILGILAGIVVFSVAGVTDTGQKAACQTEASTVRSAEEAYFANTKSYGDATNLTSAPNKFLQQTPGLVTIASTGTTFTLSWTGGATGTCGKITPAIVP